MSRIFAYCRISTLDQTTENQRREIESAGFKIKPQQIIEEHISGSAATSERPGFNRLLARLKCGDQLIEEKTSKSSAIKAQLDDLDRLTAALSAMTNVNKAVQ